MSPRLVCALGRPWLAALRYHSSALVSSRVRPSSPCAYLTPSWFCAAGSPRLAAATTSASGPASAAASVGLGGLGGGGVTIGAGGVFRSGVGGTMGGGVTIGFAITTAGGADDE